MKMGRRNIASMEITLLKVLSINKISVAMQEQKGLRDNSKICICKNCPDFNPSYSFCLRLHKQTIAWFECSLKTH
jgi:hypothetical protein